MATAKKAAKKAAPKKVAKKAAPKKVAKKAAPKKAAKKISSFSLKQNRNLSLPMFRETF